MKYLKQFGIPTRKPSKTTKGMKKGYGLPYGKRIVKGKLVDYKKEQETIARMKGLREKGYSYWKIAEIFNSMGIPTQTGKGKWHAKTIQHILKRQGDFEVPPVG